MPTWVQFFLAVCLWAFLGRVVYETNSIHPALLVGVWLVGFVAIAGCFAGGSREAFSILKIWVGSMLILASVAGLANFIFN